MLFPSTSGLALLNWAIKTITIPVPIEIDQAKQPDLGHFNVISPKPNFWKFSRLGSLLSSNIHRQNSNSCPSIFSANFRPFRSRNYHWLSIFLLLAGDCETNPGPGRGTRVRPTKTKWPCGICQKNAPTNCVRYDGCHTWFHSRYLSTNPKFLETLENTSWYCCNCGMPKFDSSFFNSSSDHDSPNASNSSQNSSHSLDPNSPPRPLLTSSPKTQTRSKDTKNPYPDSLNFLIVNFQCLWNKRVQLANLAVENGTDVIIGTETWLTSGDQLIKNSELLLDDYDIFRRDRPTKGGGGS